MPRVQVEKIHGPARREVFKGLAAFNRQAVDKPNYHLLTVTLRDGNTIVGGLAGSVWMDWLSVDILWIDEKFRGKRHGTALMKKAEAEARKQGIRNVFLNSFSFQAPKFYKKLGYREFGRLKEYPAGHYRSFLTKAL
jgi:N-acetylglutamate synthase-like GNAT family acetyltransferase